MMGNSQQKSTSYNYPQSSGVTEEQSKLLNNRINEQMIKLNVLDKEELYQKQKLEDEKAQKNETMLQPERINNIIKEKLITLKNMCTEEFIITRCKNGNEDKFLLEIIMNSLLEYGSDGFTIHKCDINNEILTIYTLCGLFNMRTSLAGNDRYLTYMICAVNEN